MVNGTYTCPRCGRGRACGGMGTTAVLTDAAPTAQNVRSRTVNGVTCTSADASISQQLYGGATPVIKNTACTDLNGTTLRNAAGRNPFWPSFARPRWLSCNQLYSR